MTKLVSNISWKPVSERGDEFAALIACDSSVDTTWQIQLQGTSYDNAFNLVPQYVCIDNSNNNSIATLSYGIFTGLQVQQFSRKTFKLPYNSPNIIIGSPSGIVNVYIANYANIIPDDANLQAIQTAAGQNVVYTFKTILNTTGQVATDGNKNIYLSNAVAQNYTLQGIIAASVPNGFYNPMIKNIGAGPWSIVPTVADGINGGTYTNAAPLILNQGDSIELRCDGAAGGWTARGHISFTSAEITIANAAGSTIAHGLGIKPEVELWMRNKTAELGYVAGQEVLIGNMLSVIGGSATHEGLTADATNIILRQNNGSETARSLQNLTTGTVTTITAANWRYFFKANAWI